MRSVGYPSRPVTSFYGRLFRAIKPILGTRQWLPPPANASKRRHDPRIAMRLFPSKSVKKSPVDAPSSRLCLLQSLCPLPLSEGDAQLGVASQAVTWRSQIRSGHRRAVRRRACHLSSTSPIARRLLTERTGSAARLSSPQSGAPERHRYRLMNSRSVGFLSERRVLSA